MRAAFFFFKPRLPSCANFGTGIYHAGAYVLCITAPLNVALNYLLIYKTELGLNGAPVATGISYWLSFLLLVGYAAFINGGQCWGGLQIRRATKDMATFSSLAILGVLHVGSEWWAFEIVALAAGRLGRVPLAAQSVIMTADQVINTIPFGLGIVTSTRVGNLLGAEKPDAASRSAHASAILSVAVGTLLLAGLMLMREKLSFAFTEDKETGELVSAVMPYVALFQIADGLNGSCGGSLRGMGRQQIGAIVNLVSYYAVALPLGIYLAFHSWGLAGLWIGQCIALYLVGILQWVIVRLRDWQAECRMALERLQNESNADTIDR